MRSQVKLRNPQAVARRWDGSRPAKTQPDQVYRPAYSNEQADQGQVTSAEPFIQAISDPAPKEQPGEEISKDRPHSVFFTVGHELLLRSTLGLSR